MAISISKKWLKNASEHNVYKRGENYRGNVKNLTKRGNCYTAFVRGSELYNVEIIDDKGEPEVSCDCPYDGVGICKHIVAVGLEIIDNNFEEAKTIDFNKNLNTKDFDIQLDTKNFYNNVFSKASERKQKDFLFNLFAQNEDVCKQFYLYMYPPRTPLSNPLDITELSNEIAAIVNDIDIDDYQGNDEYDEYEEYEDYQDYDTAGFEQAVEQNLATYPKQIEQKLYKKSWLDATNILLAIYEAAYLVENYETEYLESDWVTQIVLNIFDENVGSWIAVAENTIPTETAQTVLSLIFARRKAFVRFSYRENNPYVYFGDGLRTLMEFCLIEGHYEKETLAFLREENLINAKNVDFVEFVYMANELDEEWGQLLQTFCDSAMSDKTLLESKLMTFYLDNNKRAAFVEMAKKDFNNQKRHFDLIFKNLLQEDDTAFFKAVQIEYLFRKKDIETYKQLKKLLTEKELSSVVAQCNTKYIDLFIKIATFEKDYPTLLKTAQTYKDPFQNNFFPFNAHTNTYFDSAIQPILNIYPDEVFDMCKERILNKMGKGGQGREHYAASINTIKPLKKIESKKVHLENFVKVLRQTYNRLPAFLDELKKAGF